MNDKSKLPILIILILLMVVSLLLAFAEYHLLQKEKAVSFALQQDIEALKINISSTEEKLEQSKKKISSLEIELKESEAQIQSLKTAIAEEKSAKEEAILQVKNLTEYLDKQRDSRKEVEEKLKTAEKKLENAQIQLRALESKKIDLEKKVTSLESKIEDLQFKQAQAQKVELGTIEVSSVPHQAVTETATASTQQTVRGMPLRGLEGKVLVVNRDYNFVVINLGSSDGIRVGDIYSVFHGSRQVGEVKIEKVHDSMAAADFLTKGMSNLVSEGDRVIKKE